MQVAFFSEELMSRGGLPCFFSQATGQHLAMDELDAAIRRGETVTIRPASSSEMKRAEALVTLVEIGRMIGAKVEALLDQKPREDVTATVTTIRDAIESVGASQNELLDRVSSPSVARP